MGSPGVPRALLALACLLLLALLVGACLLWSLAMPGGFAVASAPWWLGRGLPLAVASLCAIALFSPALREPLLLGLFALPAAFGGTLLLVFPATGLNAGGGPLVLAVATAALVFATIRPGRSHLHLALPAGLLWAVLGIGGGLAMRAPPPSTTPAPLALLEQRPLAPLEEAGAEQLATLEIEHLRFTVDARLHLDETSPDGNWSLFSLDHTVQLSCHREDTRAPEHTLELDVRCVLPSPAWAHLGHSAVIAIHGGRDLHLSLAEPGAPLTPIAPLDLVGGMPAAAVYLGPYERVHLVRGAANDKGPWTHLASAPMEDGDLRLWIHEGTRRIAEIELPAFAAQASTAPSPTAGWGLPQNAIEFRGASEPDGAAQLWVSPAATSLGRGFQTVGYRRGTYRSAVRIRPMP